MIKKNIHAVKKKQQTINDPILGSRPCNVSYMGDQLVLIS